MNSSRFDAITSRYPRLRIAVVGDFFLDRYLIIDPARTEISIETGLPVHNVVAVRSQAGAAGTIVNNLVALGVGKIVAVGFCGDDGEGYELRRALADLPGVTLDHFLTTPSRRTPVYCKPLEIEPGKAPRELNRFDSKNWTETPESLRRDLASRVEALGSTADAVILMDQVDLAESGVVTRAVREAAARTFAANPNLITLADSRRGLADYPPLGFKMNASELSRMTRHGELLDLNAIREHAGALARTTGHRVFITLAERGIVAADPIDGTHHAPSVPVSGPIDVVGAGDSVTANLSAALAAGADVSEALHIAMAASSIVVHQLGTTGTATVEQIGERLQAQSGHER